MVTSFITFDRLNNALRTFHPRKPNVSLYSKGDSIGMAEDFSSQEILKDSGGPRLQSRVFV